MTVTKAPVVKVNRTYMALYNILCRYMVIYGGRRSSKSYSVSQLLVRKACEFPGRKIIVMRKVATTIRLSSWARVLAALEEAGILSQCDVNKSDRVIELPTGSTFNFVGGDDPQKLKSLEGATDYWLEEANEFEELDLDTIDAGLSAAVWPPCQIWLTFNPVPIIEGALPWLAARFILKYPHEMSVPRIEDNVCILRTWYKDNAFCPEPTVKLFKSYEASNPGLYKLWVLGEFTFLEGVIFKNWDVVDSVPTEGGVKDLGYGLDFGFSVDPSTLVHVWGRGMDTERPEVWLKEEIYETELSNQQLGRRFRELGVPKMAEIVADCAEPKSIHEIRQMGYNVHPSVKGNDSVRAGIDNMQGMSLHLIRGSTNMIKEFSTYSWKKDKDGKLLPVPQDMYNHCLDGSMLLRTKKGDRRIDEVRDGDMVASSTGWSKVVDHWQSGVEPVYLVRTESGKELIATARHFVNANGGWKAVKDLVTGDDLDSLEGVASWQRARSLLSRASSIVGGLRASVGRIASIIGERTASVCMLLFGNMPMDPCLQGVSSITSTGTPRTTGSKTSNASVESDMASCIRIPTSASNRPRPTWMPSVTGQKSGTQAPKAGNGTGSTASRRTGSASRSNGPASIAGRDISTGTGAENPGFAGTTARAPHAGRKARTLKDVSAPSVARRSWSISIGRTRRVPDRVASVSALEGSRPVFDLTVEPDHDFFANGILVHNCIDACRYRLASRNRFIKAGPVSARIFGL